MNKRSIYILSIGTLLLLSACESKERKGASAMLDTASQYYQQEAYEEALQLLDSLNKVYPKEVEAREQALALSREVRLARSRRDSLAIIPRMQALIQYTDSLYREFSLVEAPGMPDENIIRYKGYDPSSANPQDSFLDCYIASDGTLELIAATSGADTQGVTHIQVSESVGNTFVSSDTLAYDGGLNYRFQDLGRHYERLTFTGERQSRSLVLSLMPLKERPSRLLSDGRMAKRVGYSTWTKERRRQSPRATCTLKDYLILPNCKGG